MERRIFSRDRKGTWGRWRAVDWLRQWLDEPELWDLLDSLSPDRLERLGHIVERALGGDV